jgi:hypothetical protein
LKAFCQAGQRDLLKPSLGRHAGIMQYAAGVDEQVQMGVCDRHLLRCSLDAELVIWVERYQQQPVSAVLALQVLQLLRCRRATAGGHHTVVWPLQQLPYKL